MHDAGAVLHEQAGERLVADRLGDDLGHAAAGLVVPGSSASRSRSRRLVVQKPERRQVGISAAS